MGNLSIKLNIANRIYPLSIDRKDEESVRKAAKMIEDSIKDYEDNFSVRDKQDLLAMTALQFANQVIAEDGKVKIEDDGIGEQIEELDARVTDYLNNC